MKRTIQPTFIINCQENYCNHDNQNTGFCKYVICDGWGNIECSIFGKQLNKDKNGLAPRLKKCKNSE